MRRLILMRHAKSSWDHADQSDHARRLNARGRRACDAIGPWLAAKGYLPDTVLCSDATRTRETWDRLGRHLPDAPTPRLLSALYHAPAGAMMGVLADADGDCIAMLAHNPGIAEFAARLVATPPGHPRFADFPTLSTLVVEFDSPAWHALRPGRGKCVDFIVPRDLTDNQPPDRRPR